jgi:enediyne polyketide synthase
MSDGIAIVGMGCRYPDARSPAELWENALSRRRAFREMPAERLRLDDYRVAADGGSPPGSREGWPPASGSGAADPDSIYLQEAAVLTGWEFDRLRFRVAGATFRVTDLTHWLALEVAAATLADAGFEEGVGLPRDATGVLVGNSLTGEFSRSHLMRTRWPYVRRVLAAALAAEGWEEVRIAAFLTRLEESYKAPFPVPNEESLAGGLSNTIAGRICNHFDLHGGGFTVDGACASSLLAVAQACTALTAGDLDVALAGGVDLSLDPFELVGFSRAGALLAGDAREESDGGEMRVFDRRSRGFLPGEGCGFVALMRERQALAWGKRVYGVIRGWGISSDGHGGISRPEAAGQRLALARAYRRAGFDVATVPCFEGHGTGTSVGDATELAALAQALREARAASPAPAPALPAAIGSIKANIGHTKAAAGVAGLLKATLAVANQVLPPATGSEEPHAELAGADPVLRVLAAAESWPEGRPLRAGVSAMGFGGVNAHVVVEGAAAAPRRRGLSARERSLAAPPQDVELVLVAATDAAALAARAQQLAELAPRLSRAELGDLAAELYHRWRGAGAGDAAGEAAGKARAAIVASTPRELAAKAKVLIGWLAGGATRSLDPRQGVFLGVAEPGESPPEVGLLFTGQGSPAYAGNGGSSGRSDLARSDLARGDSARGAGARNGLPALTGGTLARRFPELAGLYELAAELLAGGVAAAGEAGDAGADTAVAQPAIVAHSLAGLWLLDRLGVRGEVAVGHSLGEITALCWAGACDAPAGLRLAAARGRAMAAKGEAGAMASIGAPASEVTELLAEVAGVAGGEVAIGAYNGAARTVVTGTPAAVAAVIELAAARGLTASRLKVARAFHSPLVAAAAADLDAALAMVAWAPLRRPVASTVTGALLAPDADLRALLLDQVTAPVRFSGALAAAGALARLWIEVGPGRALAEMAGEALDAPVLALDAGGPSLAGAWSAAAALFAAGVQLDLAPLFEGRFHRPFDLDRPLRFLANPCESAPLPVSTQAAPEVAAHGRAAPPVSADRAAAPAPAASSIEVLRGLVAARAELPLAAVSDDSRLLSDLHLNSITVGQLVVEASRHLGLGPPSSPTDYALATVGELAEALAERARIELAGSTPDAAGHGRGGGLQGAAGVAGIDSWVRAFTVELVDRPLPRRPAGTARGAAPVTEPGGAPAAAPGDARAMAAAVTSAGWQVVALPGDTLAAATGAALAAAANSSREPRHARQTPATDAGAGAGGVLLCLPAALDEREPGHLELFVTAARAAAGPAAAGRFVVLQQGGGGGGFARSLHLELPSVTTWVIDVPGGVDPAAAAAWVSAEVADGTAHDAGRRYVEAHYDPLGRRRVPVLRPLPSAPAVSMAAVTASTKPATASGPPGAPATASAVLPAPPPGSGLPAAIGPDDVLLVSGGGKGIGAECALAAARGSGARLAILGRSDPLADPELAANLERMAATGLRPLYLRADVADDAAVEQAVARIAAELGPVTVLLHAAGVNAPRRLGAIDEHGLRQTLAPKVAGARHLLAALASCRPDRLRLVVGFGSIIARTGLPGEAEYAMANEWLALLLARHAARHPGCRCLVADWSVWSGTGMGERLGTLEALTRQGITPIPPDAGTAELLRLLADPSVRGEVVVTGRFGNPPTLAVERPDLPLLRFLEQPRVYYPGIELVVDVEVSADSDPYLSDHVFRGEPLFAAVVGLEAMAQAAAAVTGATRPPVFEQVELRRPVAVAPGRSTTLRIAALVRAPGLVEVALRDGATGFAVDHFRTLCRFPAEDGNDASAAGVAVRVDTGASVPAAGSSAVAFPASLLPLPVPLPVGGARLAIDPPRDLYGGILFQEGRFRRLGDYRQLRATACLADIVPDGNAGWFGPYLPPALLLGDPAARDAAIHGIQACIPHAQLLPIGVERIFAGRLAADEPLQLAARERYREGDTFVYDLDILAADGSRRERWQGLRLRAVDRTRLPAAWSMPLLVPYLERRLQELFPAARLRIALEAAPGTAPAPAAETAPAAGAAPGTAAAPGVDAMPPPRQGRPARPDSSPVVERLVAELSSESAAATASAPPRLRHRPDGRPEVAGGPPVSASHAAGLVLAVAGGETDGRIGCDLEAIVERPAETWRDLLGAEGFALAELIAGQPGERPDAAATRVWTAAESLHKAGSPAGAPLLLEAAFDDGWLLLRSGGLRVASFATTVRELGGPCALAVVAPDVQPAPTASAARHHR